MVLLQCLNDGFTEWCMGRSWFHCVANNTQQYDAYGRLSTTTATTVTEAVATTEFHRLTLFRVTTRITYTLGEHSLVLNTGINN